MKVAIAACAVLAMLEPAAGASQEQIHRWKHVALDLDAGAFGSVTITAAGDDRGHVVNLGLAVDHATYDLDAPWLAAQSVLLASIEVRTEAGTDPKPWLYLVFKLDLAPAKSRRDARLRITYHDGKLVGAAVEVTDAAGRMTSSDAHLPLPSGH
jgi:hypothetical protein